jgi:1-acyl-sn-glycerol-3-phosphate acyltransferase
MISPWFAKFIQYLPENFVVYMSKVIVNKYMDKYADIKVLGKENLKGLKRPIIFVCNHLSNSDGLVLDRVLKEEDVTFIAGVKLSNDPITNIGMNVVKSISIKPNSADREALTRVVKTVKDGNNIVIFPEGTRSRTGSMIEGKKGVLLIARLAKATIVPIGLWGSDKLMPINKSGKMSDENFQHAEVIVNIGKPISLSEKEKDEDKHLYEDRALNDLMREIAVLLPEDYRGVYK